MNFFVWLDFSYFEVVSNRWRSICACCFCSIWLINQISVVFILLNYIFWPTWLFPWSQNNQQYAKFCWKKSNFNQLSKKLECQLHQIRRLLLFSKIFEFSYFCLNFRISTDQFCFSCSLVCIYNTINFLSAFKNFLVSKLTLFKPSYSTVLLYNNRILICRFFLHFLRRKIPSTWANQCLSSLRIFSPVSG